MAVLTSYWFRAELPKTAIMDFISRTPPEYYFLVPDGTWTYGMVMTDEVMEFLTNEFSVKSLEIIQPVELKKILTKPGVKVWGNQDLIN